MLKDAIFSGFDIYLLFSWLFYLVKYVMFFLQISLYPGTFIPYLISLEPSNMYWSLARGSGPPWLSEARRDLLVGHKEEGWTPEQK